MCYSDSVDEKPQMYSMAPYLRATYESKYLPVKWDEEKVYAPVTQHVVKASLF